MYERRAREVALARASDGNAMEEEEEEGTRGALPKVLVVLTGKGPLKEKYMKEVGRLQEGDAEVEGWKWVRCISMWLEAEDYPLLLGGYSGCYSDKWTKHNIVGMVIFRFG